MRAAVRCCHQQQQRQGCDCEGCGFNRTVLRRDNASFRSDEALFQTHSSESPQSTSSVLSPAHDTKPAGAPERLQHAQEDAMKGLEFPEDSSMNREEHADGAGADMFAGLILG